MTGIVMAVRSLDGALKKKNPLTMVVRCRFLFVRFANAGCPSLAVWLVTLGDVYKRLKALANVVLSPKQGKFRANGPRFLAATSPCLPWLPPSPSEETKTVSSIVQNHSIGI